MKALVWAVSRKLLLMAILSGCYQVGAQSNYVFSWIEIPFVATNQNVNAAIIRAYESNRSIWQESQLFLVGSCYMFNNDLTNARAVFGAIASSTNVDMSVRGRAEFELGRVCIRGRDNIGAETHFSVAWKKYRCLPALADLAQVYMVLDDFARYEELLPDLRNWKDSGKEVKLAMLQSALYFSQSNDQERVRKTAEIVFDVMRVTTFYDLEGADENVRKNIADMYSILHQKYMELNGASKLTSTPW